MSLGDLVLRLSRRRDALSCELCPTLVVAPKLPRFLRRDDSLLARGLALGVGASRSSAVSEARRALLRALSDAPELPR